MSSGEKGKAEAKERARKSPHQHHPFPRGKGKNKGQNNSKGKGKGKNNNNNSNTTTTTTTTTTTITTATATGATTTTAATTTGAINGRHHGAATTTTTTTKEKGEEEEIMERAKERSPLPSARSLDILHRSATTTSTPTMFSKHYPPHQQYDLNNQIWICQLNIFLETSFQSSIGMVSFNQEFHSQQHHHMLQVSQHRQRGMSTHLGQWSMTSASLSLSTSSTTWTQHLSNIFHPHG